MFQIGGITEHSEPNPKVFQVAYNWRRAEDPLAAYQRTIGWELLNDMTRDVDESKTVLSDTKFWKVCEAALYSKIKGGLQGYNIGIMYMK